MAPDGSDRKQLTSGKWEVYEHRHVRRRKWFYLTTSEKSLFEHQFYRMPVNGGAGGARERSRAMVGEHEPKCRPTAR